MTYHRKPRSGAGIACVLAAGSLLAGCGSRAGAVDPIPREVPAVTGLPPADPRLSTRLAVPARSGAAELGRFVATPGDLWVGGRCAGGDLTLRLDPVVAIPVACERLGGLPFLNQVVMRAPTEISMSVLAPEGVTWNLRVEQVGAPR